MTLREKYGSKEQDGRIKSRDVRPQWQGGAVVCLPAVWINPAVCVTFESDLGV